MPDTRRRRSRLTPGSGGVDGAELLVQGPDRCRAVGEWQGGEVGFQPAQHQRAAARAHGR